MFEFAVQSDCAASDPIVRQVALSGGIKGVASAIGLGRKSLERYYRNCSQKLVTLESTAVAQAEATLISFILNADSPPQAPLSVPPGPTRAKQIVPINFKSESGSGGGAVSLLAVGEEYVGDNKDDGLFFSQRCSNGEQCSKGEQQSIPLRPGMRGRKLFKHNASSALQGRCFEWYVVKDTDPFNDGKPKFVLHELIKEPSTGILTRTTKRWTGVGPQAMWNSMYKDPAGGNHPNGTKNGVRLCGFDDPAVIQILQAANCCDETVRSRGSFGAYSRTPVSKLKASSIRALGRAADLGFRAAMTAVCPSDPLFAWSALLESRKFCEEWLPENADAISKTPLCKGIVAAYKNVESKEAKIAILSLFSPNFKYKLTEDLFGVGHNEIYASLLHEAAGYASVQLARLKHDRFSWC